MWHDYYFSENVVTCYHILRHQTKKQYEIIHFGTGVKNFNFMGPALCSEGPIQIGPVLSDQVNLLNIKMNIKYVKMKKHPSYFSPPSLANKLMQDGLHERTDTHF